MSPDRPFRGPPAATKYLRMRVVTSRRLNVTASMGSSIQYTEIDGDSLDVSIMLRQRTMFYTSSHDTHAILYFTNSGTSGATSAGVYLFDASETLWRRCLVPSIPSLQSLHTITFTRELFNLFFFYKSVT